MFSRLNRLQDRTRLIVMGLMTAVIIVVINVEIAGKERIVRDGTTVLLALRPQDPRSLMQGDYMALRYAMSDEVARAADDAGVTDGLAVIEPGQDGIARFLYIYAGQQPGDRQLLLRFRKRGDSVRLASDAFFFEEGQWELYSSARAGELRVDEDGDAVLTGLRGPNGARLGPPLH